MSQYMPALNFQVEESIYDPNTLRDEQNFYHQGQGSVSELTKTITYVLGRDSNKYPLCMMTIGAAGYGDAPMLQNASVGIDDVQFSYPLMGKMQKPSYSAGTPYSGGDKPGIGNGLFKIWFTDNTIKRFSVLISELGTQVYIHDDGVEKPGVGWEYTAQLDPAAPEEFCPLAELAYGVKWIDYTRLVAESESRTTETGMIMPGSFKNQMSFMRLGTSWAGNAANKVMKIKLSGGGAETNVWMDWALWQFEQEWLSLHEHQFWYNKYNRAANGQIALKDLMTGKVIPRGSGVLEQITNKSSFSELTYNFLTTIIGDAFYGRNDTEGKVITLMGGTGAQRDLHRAIMKEGGTVLQDFSGVAEKFVTGSGRELALGGYFSTIYHIDGYVIKFKLNKVFDTGRMAMVSPLHPVSKLPLESHRLVFIDDAPKDGQPNIKHVYQNGRQMLDGVIQGLTPQPRSISILLGNSGGQANKYLSTDQDKSSYVRFASGGIQIMDASLCFDLTCTAGL